MTDWLTPKPAEAERLRLFRSDDDPAPLLAATPGIDPKRAVIVRMRDLGGMSLGGYLSEGFAVPDEALMAEGAALRDVSGYVTCVPPSAVTGPIAPAPGLEPLAAPRMSGAPTPAPDLSTPDAEGLAGPPPSSAPPAPGRRGGSGVLIAVAFGILAAVVVLILLLA